MDHLPALMKKSAYSATVFFFTLAVLSVGYALWNSPTTMTTVTQGNTLTASGWNAIVNNVNDLNTRMTSAPIFSAYLNQASSASISTTTKVPFNATEFDTSSMFNTSNGRFQPTIAGYYHVSLAVYMNGTGNGGSTYCIFLYKNGTITKQVCNLQNYVGGFSQSQEISAELYFNGSTDYLEGWYLWNGGTATLAQGAANTWMSGYYLRP